MQIRWTKPASSDLFNIVRRIQQDNPAAAARIAAAIYDGCGKLSEFPRLGRPGRVEGTRELVCPPLPYVVVYRVQEPCVEILRVYHGAQNWA
jgi:addiction module RelE/StbE family toxin